MEQMKFKKKSLLVLSWSYKTKFFLKAFVYKGFEIGVKNGNKTFLSKKNPN